MNLIPSLGGIFEVKFAGELVHSKDATGEFPEDDAMRTAFQAQLSKVVT